MMQSILFDTPFSDDAFNLLPMNGSVHYYPKIYTEQSSAQLIDQLQSSLTWESDRLMMFGKLITTRRKVAWVGDPKCSYTYSGVKKKPQAWTPELLSIKTRLEELSRTRFNSCLLNLYHDGNDGMGWHSDDEKELNPHSPIASLSLGARRKFAFRHKKEKKTISLFLDNGSALIMHAPTQEFWQHALLKTKMAAEVRINLTFRSMNIDDE